MEGTEEIMRGNEKRQGNRWKERERELGENHKRERDKQTESENLWRKPGGGRA